MPRKKQLVEKGMDAILEQKNNLLIFLFFLLISLIVYWPIMNNSQISDDYRDLVKTVSIPLSGFWNIFGNRAPTFMRPVPYMEIWLLFKMFGWNWFVSHFINVCMHAGNAFLLCLLLKRLKASVFTAVLASTVFTLSPLATEAVTWTAARFDVWLLFFILLSLILYTTALQKSSRVYFVGAMISSAVAFLCKEAAIILLIIIPAIEFTLESYPKPDIYPDKHGWKNGLREILPRIMSIYAIFACYLILRFLVLGGLGGYKSVPLFGKPNVNTLIHNIITFLSPLNRIEVSKAMVVIVGIYSGILCLLSLGVVAFYWKKAERSLRRLWKFLAVFSVASILPIYPAMFMEGTNQYLLNVRLYYITLLGFIALIVVGLLEFTKGNRVLHIMATWAILILAPVYFWGVQQNNRMWEHAAAVSYTIIEETFTLLPNPPSNSRLYFKHVPYLVGSQDFASALPEAIALKYNRDDLRVMYVEPDPIIEGNFEDPGPDPPDGYLFVFDRNEEKIHLERGPKP